MFKYMTIKDKKLLHKAQVKQSILDFAQEIASTEGWEAVTMRGISAKIEFALPVIYTHFKNKEAIISTLASKGFVILLEALQAIVDSQIDIPTKAKQLAYTYINFAKTNKALYLAMYGQEGVSSFLDGNLKEGEKMFNFIHDWLKSLVEINHARIPNPWESTKLIWATLHGLITLDNINQINDSKTQVETIASDFIDILLEKWGVKA
jgi:AcrR family transcriptional regulator